MDLLRPVLADTPGKEGVHIPLLELVGTPAELAGHGYRPLLAQDVSHLFFPQGAKKARHPPFAAAALEVHR